MNENASAILAQMEDVLRLLRMHKPEERNELARRYAVTITEMEKVVAYFAIYGSSLPIDRVTR